MILRGRSAFGVKKLNILWSRLRPASRSETTVTGSLVQVAVGDRTTLSIVVQSAEVAVALYHAIQERNVVLLIGDESEFDSSDLEQSGVNIVTVEIAVDNRSATIRSSLVGLPPVFLAETGDAIVVSSPNMPLPASGGNFGGVSAEGAADVLRWGHPIDGRTLLRGVSQLKSGMTVRISDDGLDEGSCEVLSASDFEMSSSEDLISAQCSEFLRTAGRMGGRNSIVSLSGGLDSRAVAFAMLLAGRQFSVATLGADGESLDAQLAAAFCEAYGLDHRIIVLGDDYKNSLPERILKTAELTYGVAVFQQSIDYYMYEQLGPDVKSRVTGNLGNQVGRGGVESLAAYSLQYDSLWSPEVLRAFDARPAQPWYIDRMNAEGFARTLFQQEVSYWSVPNYVVGSAFAVQQTPYASRRLLELSSAVLRREADLRNVNSAALRRRDLRHRLMGVPLTRSFQRRLLATQDSKGGDVPMNWGWLARGGWSLPWVMEAVGTIVDAAIIKWSPTSTFGATASRFVRRRVTRSSSLVDWNAQVRGPLRELINDTLRSEVVMTSGMFSRDGLVTALDLHFSGKQDLHRAITSAFEIACACRLGSPAR